MAGIKNSKNILSNLIIIAAILIIAMAYFYPQLEGKILEQSDITHFKGTSKEISDYRKETGKQALWTGNVFSGMPTYLISVSYPGNFVKPFQLTFRKLFHPAAMLILYMLGFYILLLTLGVNKWQSLVGAIAFGFSSYFLIIIGAGHNTKAYAIGYIALLIAGMLMVFKGKRIPGVILFTLGLSLNIFANHLQITYYTFILAGIYVIIELINSVREKRIVCFGKNIGLLAIGAVIAVGMNFSQLYTTYEYSKFTIRGPSELTTEKENRTTGLDKDYVVQYSLGIDETMTFLIPDYMGGASQINPDLKSESYKVLRQQTPQNARQNLAAISMYHGDQPPTSGPVYLGAIVVFLFVLSLFIVKGTYKWWLVAATLLSLFLAWGKNFMWLTNIFLDYIPLYNKFRAPTIMLVVVEFCVPLLGFIGLSEIFKGNVPKEKFLRALRWSAIITGGITLIFMILPGIAGDFSSPYDTRYPDWLTDAVLIDRKNMLRSDAFRSFIFIDLATVTLYVWHLLKTKAGLFTAVLGILILIDLWGVDQRYLNKNNFESKKQSENIFTETPADKAILLDKDISYRVLPYISDAFMNARASYFHKNVGGYHAAKLRRYNEVIEHCLFPEMDSLSSGLRARRPVNSVFAVLPVLNMLNTKYLIVDVNQQPLRNPMALGNVWFVNNYRIVNNADEEIAALSGFDPGNTAIIDKRFENYVSGKTFTANQNENILLEKYEPNYLMYKYNARSEQLAVFSEVYYEKGWNAYIDGEKTPHFRANYILRAMVVPQGEHQVEFKFEPKSYYIGNKVSYASSIILLLIIIGFVGNEIRKKQKAKQ
ncbi:MAG: YfhO family protein [Prolixibacteraceae bacterium]|nr:YfhO family protein [Prolixibacteraceae bacterium]